MPCSNAIISLAIALNAISITQIFVSASQLSLCVSHFSFAFLFSFGHEVSLALLRCFAFAFWTIYWVREMTITKDLTRENSKWRKKKDHCICNWRNPRRQPANGRRKSILFSRSLLLLNDWNLTNGKFIEWHSNGFSKCHQIYLPHYTLSLTD